MTEFIVRLTDEQNQLKAAIALYDRLVAEAKAASDD